MNLNRSFIIVALIVIGAVPAAAQGDKCSLKLAELHTAQELFGLRIGMTVEQVKGVVPSLQPGRTDDLGFATTSFSPDFDPQIDKAVFAGVRTVSLEFLDGRLFTLWIGYKNSFKWKALDEFVPGISGALGIPADAWVPETQRYRLECGDFQATAAMIAEGPSLRLADKGARELWEQRRAEKEEKRSEETSDEPK